MPDSVPLTQPTTTTAARYEQAIREAIDEDGSCARAGISAAFLAVYIRTAIEPLVAAEIAPVREQVEELRSQLHALKTFTSCYSGARSAT